MVYSTNLKLDGNINVCLYDDIDEVNWKKTRLKYEPFSVQLSWPREFQPFKNH